MADYTIDAQVYRDGVLVGSGYGGASTYQAAVHDLQSCLVNDPPPDSGRETDQ